MKITKSTPNFDMLTSNSLSDRENQQEYHLENKLISRTSQCSIQVNMDLENQKETDDTAKKRQRKKQYRRRKKEKTKQLQKEAKLQLTKIIQNIYTGEARFDERQFIIQNCLRKLQRDTKFHKFLDQVIKMHVKTVQKDIWDHAQIFLQENPWQNENSHKFYVHMVNKVYEEYLYIRCSSHDIEKIINMYMKITAEDKQNQALEYSYKNLDKNTFNYLIQSDQTLQSLIRIFHQNIGENCCPARIKLNLLLEILHEFDFTQSQDEQNENSTQQQETLQRNSRRKRNKKKKVKDNDISPQYKDVLERIQSFNIQQEDRNPCRVHSEWLLKLQNQLDFALKNLK